MFEALRWRLAGPHRGGRSVAVAGDPRESLVFYFGACAGGVFKTSDAGASWRPVSDGFFKTGSVGALAVADADPNVIYVGMGEACIRANVSHGDGVYRSEDGGRTWRHLGLVDTRHIARVRIDPRDPDRVYVAAFGHAWGTNEERGVFRSTDGGRTWEQALSVDAQTGACDLSLDPNNPRVLYAAMWQAQRTPHSLESGGPGSGIFKSTDSGDTWIRLDGNPGLPAGIKGRIGVTASPAQPGRVWAAIEAQEGGIFRSDDGGATWRRMSESHEQLQRPWYFMHIFADPADPDTLYSLDLQTWKSIDGGVSWSRLPVPHGDNHDLWIDPRHAKRMIIGNDGGAAVSFDGGETWSTQYNQPTAQFYHVTTDSRFPYRIYGSQQDNTTVSLPSRSDRGAITRLDFYPVGGHESGYIAVRQDNPDIAYGGVFSNRITRYDHKSGQVQDVTVWPEDPIGWAAKDVRYRFNWTFPIVLSPHDQGVLYTAGNHVFRSRDEGMSWEVVSPDLTRNDIAKLQYSGGAITPDNYCTEYYCTIFAFAESPVEQGVLWAGSDDGLIHVSRDDGRTWENVTPSALPEWAQIMIVEPSPFDAAAAYVAATRYKLDDPRPYLLKTTDSGRTWTSIDAGIPDNDFMRVIRADPARHGLLYAGTETGVYVSFDDGASWQPLQLNLPVCPIYDLAVKDGDLVAATHGRSFWILDDLTPLHQLTDEVRAHRSWLFPPRPAHRLHAPSWYLTGEEPGRKTFVTAAGELVATAYVKRGSDGSTDLEFVDAGQNPPAGVVVHYYLHDTPGDDVTLTFRDESGQVIKRFTRRATADRRTGEPVPGAQPGLNRFVWDMRYPDPEMVGESRLFNYWSRTGRGPLAPPGSYRVELEVADERHEATFEIRKDPRVTASDEDLHRQFALLQQINAKLSQVNRVVNEVGRIRPQLGEWLARLDGQGQQAAIAAKLRELDDRLAVVYGQLHQERVKVGSDFAVFPPGINSRLLALTSFVGGSETPPTTQMYAVFEDLSRRADAQIDAFRRIVTEDLPRAMECIRSAEIPLISVDPGVLGTSASSAQRDA